MCLCNSVEKFVDSLAQNSHGCYNDLEVVCIDNWLNKKWWGFTFCIKSLNVVIVQSNWKPTCKCHIALSSNCERIASGEWEIDIPRCRPNEMPRSNTIMLQRSSIFVDAFSYRSSSWGRCASSSHAEPQPSTRAKSLPVPRGSTAIWHCFWKEWTEIKAPDYEQLETSFLFPSRERIKSRRTNILL